nr:uncharacterized protein LOC123117053 [Triticum aestivum]
MASSSSIVAAPALIPIAVRLHRSNFLVWRAQAMAAIRGAQLVSYLDPDREQPEQKLRDKDGKPTDVPNPAYDIDKARDSQVLSFIFNSISAPIMVQVAHCDTTAKAWAAIREIFISQTQAHVVNTRIALSTTKKGNSTMSEYIGRMKALGDEMASVGKPLTDDDMVSYILAGLNYDYVSFVSTICARTQQIKVSELYSQLISFESRLAMF